MQAGCPGFESPCLHQGKQAVRPYRNVGVDFFGSSLCKDDSQVVARRRTQGEPCCARPEQTAFPEATGARSEGVARPLPLLSRPTLPGKVCRVIRAGWCPGPSALPCARPQLSTLPGEFFSSSERNVMKTIHLSGLLSATVPFLAGCGSVVGTFAPPQTVTNPAGLTGATLDPSSALITESVRGTSATAPKPPTRRQTSTTSPSPTRLSGFGLTARLSTPASPRRW